MATITFLWGTEPQVTTGRTFLWGLEPQFLSGITTTSILGHSFRVILPPVTDILGHQFGVGLASPNILGHRFSIRPSLRVVEDIENKDFLSQDLVVTRDEPAQILDSIVLPPQPVESREQIDEKQRIEVAVKNFEQFVKAAEEMQLVLGEKLKQRVIKINPNINPDAREAIRRLFGVNSDEITYDMFKKCLAWRSELLAAGRKKYGTGNGST
jgi:hypothetical protein